MPDSSFDALDDDILRQSNRLQILSPEEYDALWGLPRFTHADRDIFFSLTAPERVAVGKLRTPRTKVHFLLQLGYFRARQRVFRFKMANVRDDIDYLRRRYLEDTPVPNIDVSDHTRKQQIETILQLLRYRLCDRQERAELEERAIRAARISSRPVYVLRELVDYLRQRRIVLPGYSLLQDIITRALTLERRRLTNTLGNLIGEDHEAALDRLLTDPDGLHAITNIKHEPQDFSHKQLLAEVRRGEQVRPLVELADRATKQADLSIECV